MIFKGMKLLMTANKPITIKRIVLIIILFFLLLTSFRMGWMMYHKAPDHSKAENGIVDLSDWAFSDKTTITLDGEWEFYPNKFITSFSENDHVTPKKFISVPEDWQKALNNDHEIHTYGHGTYRLKVILPDDGHMRSGGLRFKEVFTSAAVYINDDLLVEFNKVGETPETN